MAMFRRPRYVMTPSIHCTDSPWLMAGRRQEMATPKDAEDEAILTTEPFGILRQGGKGCVGGRRGVKGEAQTEEGEVDYSQDVIYRARGSLKRARPAHDQEPQIIGWRGPKRCNSFSPTRMNAMMVIAQPREHGRLRH